MEMNQLFCQCCGMPLTEELFSREPDGSVNEDYCKWCYTDGKFAYDSKEKLLDFLMEHVPNTEGIPDDERRAAYDGYLSQLKRWKEA
ncbi:MAG: zinc ribbon domain-containing protein [Ruminococcus sp.]|nr:zinc ribbon domain-containing protein [Ruminococcus sp.]